MPDDHRQGPRRRGAALYQAIYDATMAELADVGYDGLTMEGVARRAGASKASLYRRWSDRTSLVRDTAQAAVAKVTASEELPDTGSVRSDLITLFRRVTDVLGSPLGEAVRGLLIERLRAPSPDDPADQIHLVPRRSRPVLEVLERGVARGEVRPTALTPLVARVGPSLLCQHFLSHGAPIGDAIITEVVDDVVLPILRPCLDDG